MTGTTSSSAARAREQSGQAALYRGPGEWSALQVWRRRVGVRGVDVRRAAARVLADETDRDDCATLVGLSPAALASPPVHPDIFSRTGLRARLANTQADVVVQVAGTTLKARLNGLRRAAAHLRLGFYLDSELLGGRLGDGREAFGFRDGAPPSRDEVDRVGVMRDGPLAGCSWLLAQRWEQNVPAFTERLVPQQEAVMGVDFDGALLSAASPYAHVPLMRASVRVDDRPRIVRRGFPYRADGTEGLAFVAATREPSAFVDALDAMLGARGSADRLLRYAVPLEGGLYVAPPNADWLLS